MADSANSSRATERSDRASVLVVGAGVAGIRAALDLAEVGVHVVLIDASPAIGGILQKLDHQFMNNHCGMCRMLPEVGTEQSSRFCLRKGLFHENIEILPFTSVQDVQGEPGAFAVELRRASRWVANDRCGDCPGPCVEACPISVPDEFNHGLTQRKAIYCPDPYGGRDSLLIDRRACDQCGDCVSACPADAIELGAPDASVTVEVDAIILATGTSVFRAREDAATKHLNVSPNVVTALELERMLGLMGPRGTSLLRPSDGKPVQRIAWIQCVGSRDRKHDRDVCSSICCMFALKEAMWVRAIDEVEATIFCMDLRGFGKDFDRYRRSAEECGVRLIRRRVQEILPTQGGGLRIRTVTKVGGGSAGDPHHHPFDLVVLSTGLTPHDDQARFGELFGWNASPIGFVPTSEFDKIKSPASGVFCCGAITGPTDISESIVSATAAASEAHKLIGSLGRKVSAPGSEAQGGTVCTVEPRVLVVGGGLAGLRAARSLADRGVDVHLVEKQSELGGRFANKGGGDSTLGQSVRTLRKRVIESERVVVHLNAEILSSQSAPGRRDTILKTDNGEHVSIAHGATIIATGGHQAATTAYGYGTSDRIMTQSELENRLARGEMTATDLRVVVMIQCVDSREADRHAYCSRTCCIRALRNAAKIRAIHPDARVFIAYRDMMTIGLLEQEYSAAREAGVSFIRTTPQDRPSVDLADTRPVVTVMDPTLRRPLQITADTLVLSTAIEPDRSSAHLAETFGLACDHDGFFVEADAKWRPVDCATDGMYVAGAAVAPQPAREVLAQAEAAAHRAFTRLSRPVVTIPGRVAEVHHAFCARCQACIDACSYHARTFDPAEGCIVVDAAGCRGCGLCTTACPNSATRLESMGETQVMATLEAALQDVGARDGVRQEP